MSARPKTPTHADEKHAILYGHPIPENSFAVRDLVHKLPDVGLFDLRHTEDGAHACTFCGACQKACPVDCIDVRRDPSRSHGKGKERHFAGTITLDERRCMTCNHCMETCKFDALVPTDLYWEHRRRVQDLAEQDTAALQRPRPLQRVRRLASSSTRCSSQVKSHYVVSGATGCLEVSTTRYPYTAWKGSYIHTNFENAAATLSGVETAFRALYKRGKLEERVKFIAFGGDGGTYDIGLQALSGAMERGHDMLYVCYDNGGYMNTGFQRSSATPHGAWTTTSPVGEELPGKLGHSKNLTEIMVAHRLPYVAQSSPHDPQDLIHKASKALEIEGPTFLNVLSPCPRGWRTDNDEGVDLIAPGHRDLLLAALRGQRGRVPPHLPAAAQAAAGRVAGAPGPLRPPGAPRQRAPAGDSSRSGSTSSGTCCCASATRSPRTSGTRRAAATRPSRS